MTLDEVEETAETRPRRGPDPLGPLLSLAALAVFLLHGFQGVLSRDLAVYAYGAEQAADGVPPYVSILNRAGPLAHLVPALGVLGGRLVGIDELLGIRLLMMVLSIACVWLLYVLGRDLLGSRLAGAVSASTLLAFEGFVTHATGGPREKTAMLLFMLCALLAVARRRWLLAGGFVALATLCWQPVFLIGVTAAGVAMTALRGREILRALLSFMAGGLVPTALCVLGFQLAGARQELFDGFLLINAEYTVQTGLLTFLGADATASLQSGFGWSLWLLLGGLAAILVAALRRLPAAARTRDAAGMGLVAAGAAAVTSVGWSFRAFNGWPDAVVVLPMAALGIGAAACAVRAVVKGRAGTVLVTGAAVAILVVAAITSVQTRDVRLEEQVASTEAVLGAAPPGATVMSFGAPQPLVLTNRTNPSRHQMFRAGLAEYVDDTYPGGLAGFAEFVADEQPTFLTFDDPDAYPWLADVLERDYRRVANSPRWNWYASRSLGPDTIKAIREAAAQVQDAFSAPAPSAVK